MRFASRVEYRERQRLRAGDLQAEQDYLLGLAGRHYLGPHTWGVVRGLQVTVEEKIATISPGIAIDGYGREIMLDAPVELPLPEVLNDQFVYIHYCERSEARCHGNPTSRWQGVPQVFLSQARLRPPKIDPDLLVASAAGQLSDNPPWPVLLGAIGRATNIKIDAIGPKFKFLANDDDYRFVCLRAAGILSPSGRALLRIGQERLADLYYFSIAIKDKQGALQNRFAIDRDGNHHIWGNLFLQSTGYSELIVAPKLGVVLVVSSPSVSGREVLLRTSEGVDDQGRDTLKIQFLNKESSEILDQATFRPGNQSSINTSLRNFNKRPFPVSIRRLAHRPSTAETLADSSEAVSKIDALDDRGLHLKPSGTLLNFDVERRVSKPVVCGCGDGDKPEPTLPKGFIFGPAAVAPTIPDSRDIYCIRTGTKERPEEEFRISLGLLAGGDFTPRLSIGGTRRRPESELEGTTEEKEDGGSTEKKNGLSFVDEFIPGLQVRGDGSVILGKLDPPGQTVTSIPEMIKVTGTVDYPPIKPDPRDPLFNFLINLAFFNGLLALSSSLVKVTFENLPPFIERESKESDQEWQYDVLVHNLGLTEPLIRLSGEEDIIGEKDTKTNRELAIPPRVDKESTGKATIKHLVKNLPAGNSIQIEVRAKMKAGSAIVAGQFRSQGIPVFESPAIGGIPDSITVGAQKQFRVAIENGRSQKLSLIDIQVEGAGAPQTLVPKSKDLDPGDSTETDLATIPAPSVGDKDLTISVKVNYQWQGQDKPTNKTVQKIVKVNEAGPP